MKRGPIFWSSSCCGSLSRGCYSSSLLATTGVVCALFERITESLSAFATVLRIAAIATSSISFEKPSVLVLCRISSFFERVLTWWLQKAFFWSSLVTEPEMDDGGSWQVSVIETCPTWEVVSMGDLAEAEKLMAAIAATAKTIRVNMEHSFVDCDAPFCRASIFALNNILFYPR